MTQIKYDRGDTLVEVILSFAVFAVVAVSVSVLMTRGLSIGQQSLEITVVREQVSAQAEMLRFARYSSEYQSIWTKATDAEHLMSGIDASKKPTDCAATPPKGSFVLFPSGGKLLLNDTLSDNNNYRSPGASSFVEDNTGRSHGVRIQAARAENKSGNPTAVAYDFYIHACWYLPSSEMPQVLTTMVRLYG